MQKKIVVKRMIKAMKKQPTQTLLMASIILVFILLIVQVLRRDPQVEKLDWLKNLFGIGEETNSSSSTIGNSSSANSTVVNSTVGNSTVVNSTVGNSTVGNSTQILSVTPISPTEMHLSWVDMQLIDNNDTLVLDFEYIIEYTESVSILWTEFLTALELDELETHVTNLEPNTEYNFRVTKQTPMGYDPPLSIISSVVTVSTQSWNDFFAPTLSIANVTSDSITLQWVDNDTYPDNISSAPGAVPDYSLKFEWWFIGSDGEKDGQGQITFEYDTALVVQPTSVIIDRSYVNEVGYVVGLGPNTEYEIRAVKMNYIHYWNEIWPSECCSGGPSHRISESFITASTLLNDN